MPSRVDRRTLERALRAAALLALGALVWRAWRPPAHTAGVAAVRQTSALPAALARATDRSVPALDLTIDSLPGRRERAWLRALAGAGTTLHWRAVGARDVSTRTTNAPPPDSASRSASDVSSPVSEPLLIAAVAEPLAEPSGRARLAILGAPGTSVALGDAAGSLDETTLSSAQTRVMDATIEGTLRAATSRGAALAALRDSVVLRPILVIARAGWEGKFTVATLEEAGWKVEARFRVAPGADVRQGATAPLDTARYAAVVALDESAAAVASDIVRFVRSGGGAIVAPAAASIATLAPILPARRSAAVTPLLGAFASEAPRRALAGNALANIRDDAVVLEKSGTSARIVGARVDAGRVLMLGYDDTWRWRMEGDDAAPNAHRRWWSSLVSSVAYAPLVQLTDVARADEAPLAALVAALGPSTYDFRASSDVAGVPWNAIFFAIFCLMLLAEWASRRLRGVR